jgi:cellulose synthase (UDP-forming)
MMYWVRILSWLGCGFIAIALMAQPVSVETQLALSLSAILTMIMIWKFVKGPVARQMFLAVGSFIVMRYMYWRITSTMPPLSDPLGFFFGGILLIAEIYCVGVLVISLLINVDPLKRPRLEREEDDEKLPTVDVFIPTYNEDEYILATTIAAAKSMDYPPHKLKVWLLDDGGSDQKCNDKNPEKAEAARQRRADLKKLCVDLGAIYLTRKKNEHAKAGNMNEALKVSNGEIVVVFDADHAPFRAFLRETVGHFALDPRAFLVQTPHVFLNPDPIEKNLKTFDRMPSENEMFYSVTQCGLDKWNGSFFCGSAALLRREALETVGGFSGITITEDCETALDLHSTGWNSVFVDKPLIAGLQPETFASFIGQRSRWGQGMFQILLLKNPVMKKGLSFIQKVCYLSSMTFWFFPLPRMIFMLAPLIYIVFNIKIFVSNLDEAIAYTSTYIVINLMLQNYLFGSVRWPWVSELYEYLQGVFLVRAMGAVALNLRAPTFNVTAKGLTLDNNHLSELSWPFFAIWGALFSGCLVAAWRYFFEPGVSNLMVVVGAWNAFNMIIAGAALGSVAERAQPDRHPRLGINRRGVLYTHDQQIPVNLVNVSAGGCGIVFPEEKPPFEMVPDHTVARLWVEPLGEIVTSETIPLVFKHSGQRAGGDAVYGFEFTEMQPDEYYVLADLMYADSDALPNFLATRRIHKNVFAGTGQFLVWGLTEPMRAFSYLRKKAQEEAAAAVPQPDTGWLHKLLKLANAGKKPAAQKSAETPAKAA